MSDPQLELCIPVTVTVRLVIRVLLGNLDHAPVHAHRARVVDAAGAQFPKLENRVAGFGKRGLKTGSGDDETPGAPLGAFGPQDDSGGKPALACARAGEYESSPTAITICWTPAPSTVTAAS